MGNHDVIENPIEAKRLIGYLPESAPLYTDMTVEGFLGFCAEVRGISGADKAKAIDRAMDMCFLEQMDWLLSHQNNVLFLSFKSSFAQVCPRS